MMVLEIEDLGARSYLLTNFALELEPVQTLDGFVTHDR